MMKNNVTELRPRTTGNVSLQSTEEGSETESISDSLLNAATARALEIPDESTVSAEQVNRSQRQEDCPEVISSFQNGVGHETDVWVSRKKSKGRVSAQPRIPPNGFNSTQPSGTVMNRQSSIITGPTVFFTYLKEEKPAWNDIMNMYKDLRRKGIRTRIGENERQVLAMSINAWLNDNVETSNFIIVCVDKSYKNTIARGNYDRTNQLHLQTHYIFNLLQTEYMMNQCLNFRVLPVLVGGATLLDVPLFLQNTTVYQWPQKKAELMNRIFRHQEYSAPELGNEPVAIFDSCTD